MSEFTPYPRVLPTPELQPAAAPTQSVTPAALEVSTPRVDRGSIWAYLKRAATEGPLHLGKELSATSVDAGTSLGESSSSSAGEVGSELVGGSKARLLVKVYLSLKGFEERLRHHATESHSRFVRWAAEKSAALVGFVATLVAPREEKTDSLRSASPEAPHRKRTRLKASPIPSEAEADFKQTEQSPSPGESVTSEEFARRVKESEAAVLLHGGLLLGEQRREEKEKDKLSAQKERRDREAHIAVQEEQLLALALIDGVAGPEVYEILASLRQPYASPSAVRDGIEATNREDRRNLLRRFEEFVVGLPSGYATSGSFRNITTTL